MILWCLRRRGQEYCVHDYTDYIYPTDKDDETNIRLVGIIEEEFEHLQDFNAPYDPSIICIKKVRDN